MIVPVLLCSGRPSFRSLGWGDPPPCTNEAQLRLADSRWRRPMCVDCAVSYQEHCLRSQLPRPLFYEIGELGLLEEPERREERHAEGQERHQGRRPRRHEPQPPPDDEEGPVVAFAELGAGWRGTPAPSMVLAAAMRRAS